MFPGTGRRLIPTDTHIRPPCPLATMIPRPIGVDSQLVSAIVFLHISSTSSSVNARTGAPPGEVKFGGHGEIYESPASSCESSDRK